MPCFFHRVILRGLSPLPDGPQLLGLLEQHWEEEEGQSWGRRHDMGNNTNAPRY